MNEPTESKYRHNFNEILDFEVNLSKNFGNLYPAPTILLGAYQKDQKQNICFYWVISAAAITMTMSVITLVILTK